MLYDDPAWYLFGFQFLIRMLDFFDCFLFRSFDIKGNGHAAFATWPLFIPAMTYSPMHLSRTVQSAQQGLTSVFGMGTGVSPAV